MNERRKKGRDVQAKQPVTSYNGAELPCLNVRRRNFSGSLEQRLQSRRSQSLLLRTVWKAAFAKLVFMSAAVFLCSAVRPHDAQTSAKMKTTCAKTLWINSALNLARKLRVLDCRLPLRQTFEKVSEKDPQ